MPVDQNDLVVGPVVPAGGVTVISLDFFFEEAAWLEVYRGASETPLVLGADYTVAGEGTNTGSITLTVAANGTDPYAVYLKVPAERSTDLQIRGGLGSQPLNTELDRIIQMIQGLQTQIERTLRISRTSLAVPPLVAPDAASRDNAVLGFDATGLNLVLLDDVMRLADLQNAIATFGNVPAPTAPQIGRFLRATGVGVFAWQLVAAVEALAALTPAADRYPFFTGASTASLGVITALARQLLDDPDQATMRGTIGAQQAAAILDTLTSISASLAAGDMIVASGPNALAKFVPDNFDFWTEEYFAFTGTGSGGLFQTTLLAAGTVDNNDGLSAARLWHFSGAVIRSSTTTLSGAVIATGRTDAMLWGKFRFRSRVRFLGTADLTNTFNALIGFHNGTTSVGSGNFFEIITVAGPQLQIRGRTTGPGGTTTAAVNINQGDYLLLDIEADGDTSNVRFRVWRFAAASGKPVETLLLDETIAGMFRSGGAVHPRVSAWRVGTTAAAILNVFSVGFGMTGGFNRAQGPQ